MLIIRFEKFEEQLTTLLECKLEAINFIHC